MNSRYEVKKMLADKVKLSAKEILEKEFKTGVRGYKQEEVDKFLDMVIKDYETFHQEIEKLQQENLHLSKQLEEAVEQGKRQPAQSNTTNFDILKRLSNLEKHVFGSKLYD
ncbi:DivIVA domain-containing protein [Bacillus sp. JUb11]|jgi:DivIVA domain-containing protein|nr:DivIVA domain-containing protein [Bacillus sp. JUb11]